MNKYKYCPICKAALFKKNNSLQCKRCGYRYYNNVVCCTSALPIKGRRLLLAIRKYEPYKGEYDLIGGFLSPKEKPQEALIREVKEETGLDIKIIKCFGCYPDKYGKNGVYTLNIQYLVKITGGKAKAQDDVKALEWVDIEKIKDIKLRGFKNTKETLTDLYNYCKKKD